MKALVTILTVGLFQIISSTSIAQTTYNDESQVPLNPFGTELYGTDVLIQPNVSEDQSAVRISCAYNGWLYSAYLITSGGFRVARSIDNGLTWTYSSTLRFDYYLTAIDLVVTGMDAAGLKVWVVNSGFMKSNIDIWDVSVEELNGDLVLTGSTVLDQILSNSGYPGVAIASDYKYPSAGANPYSIGVLYSKAGNARDSVIFRSSGDGGVTFDNHKAVASMQSYLGGKVALAFGRSQSHPEGRYFAAWAEAPYWDPSGQIYTAYTDPNFNSAWTAPFRVDDIPQNSANTGKNPVIACQANNTDNNSMEFTTVILFDRYDQSAGKFGIVGVYNTNPSSSNNWYPTLVSDPMDPWDIQPDITFDPDYNNFYATWCDSTGQNLQCFYKNIEMPVPNSWMLFSTAYNDSPNLLAPYPRVAINSAAQQVVHVWSGQVSGMAGNATFDGSSLPVGISEPKGTALSNDICISPNPCQTTITISFELEEPANVRLTLYNLVGQEFLTIPGRNFTKGNQQMLLSLDNLVPGVYIVKLVAGNKVSTGRIHVSAQ